MEKESKYDYDFFVIGGGSGGIAAAKEAVLLGQKVGLADFVKPSPRGTTWGLGGTCVNVGCIPKKLMHFVSLMGTFREDMKMTGWDVNTETPHNWESMLNQVNMHIKKLNWDYSSSLTKQGIDYHNALAQFMGPHTIMLTNQQGEVKNVTADKILIAVGGRPNHLNTENSREICQTSDDIFWAKEEFKKTLVIGSGYIGMECGGFLSGLGKDVSILYRSKILRGFDEDMVEKVVNFMKKEKVKFVKGTLVSMKKEERIKVTLKVDNEGKIEEVEEEYDNILLAIGRTPVTKELNLEQVGIITDQKGKIPVNEKWQTKTNNIYAIGDVVSGSLELTPVAIREGKYLVHGLFQNQWKSINYGVVATTIFTPLEYSKSGLNENSARQKYGDENIEVYHSIFKPLEWNLTWERGEEDCYIKVIVHKTGNKVLGIHYCGPNAGEVMQGFSIIVRLGLPYESISDTIGIHPTTAEELTRISYTKKDQPVAKYEGC